MAEHPITHPSLEQVEHWATQSPVQPSDESWAYELFIVDKAVRFGADQELEACCEWFLLEGWHPDHPNKLRAARRPKAPSQKEEAIDALETIIEKSSFDKGACMEYVIIRLALESLPE